MMTMSPTSGCTRGTATRAARAITAAAAAAAPTIARSRASYGTRGGATCSASPSAAPVIHSSLDWLAGAPVPRQARYAALALRSSHRSVPALVLNVIPLTARSRRSPWRRGRSFAGEYALRDEGSRRWRRVRNPHRSIEQRQRVAEAAAGTGMHPQHGLAATKRRAQRRQDLDSDSGIDHIVQLSSPGSQRYGGAANLLG